MNTSTGFLRAMKMIRAKDVFFALVAVSALLLLWLLYSGLSGSARLPEPGSAMGLAAIFVVGLFTGFHCVGMCGGFCAASAKTREGVALYLGAKTLSYAVIGVALGALGSVVAISMQARAMLALVAGLFMVMYALNVFGVKLARQFFAALPRVPLGDSRGGPVMAGLLNGFVPCSPLQAMQLFALSTASAVQGGLVMLAFGLGTVPVMAGFGLVVSTMSASRKTAVFKASALLVLVLGVLVVMNGADSLGLSSLVAPGVTPTPAPELGLQPGDGGDVQVVRSELWGAGYSPSNITVQAGKPAHWIIDVKELTHCNKAVKIASLGIQQDLHMGENIVELPAMEPGIVEYTCWMNMLHGSIIVE